MKSLSLDQRTRVAGKVEQPCSCLFSSSKWCGHQKALIIGPLSLLMFSIPVGHHIGVTAGDCNKNNSHSLVLRPAATTALIRVKAGGLDWTGCLHETGGREDAFHCKTSALPSSLLLTPLSRKSKARHLQQLWLGSLLSSRGWKIWLSRMRPKVCIKG